MVTIPIPTIAIGNRATNPAAQNATDPGAVNNSRYEPPSLCDTCALVLFSDGMSICPTLAVPGRFRPG